MSDKGCHCPNCKLEAKNTGLYSGLRLQFGCQFEVFKCNNKLKEKPTIQTWNKCKSTQTIYMCNTYLSCTNLTMPDTCKT